MADKKISQLTAKGSKIASTDRVPIAQDNGGGTFATRYVTGAEINEVLLDTSPQLGGDLDVNTKKITSASNGNIKIEPNGTGAVLIGGNDTQPSELRFMELLSNGSSYVGFKAPADIITSRIYTLPITDGTNGQFLKTNGSGTLSWDGPKKYVALISQTGTSAPTATVLENTLGGTVVWTRTAAGAYTGTLTGAFTNNKTFLLMGTIPYLNNPAYILDRSSDNTIYIQTSVNNIQSDNILSNTSIEIKVYP